MKSNNNDFSGIANFSIAFFITLCITGVFAFVGFALPTHKILPTSYYRIYKPPLLRSIYTLLGVRYFKSLLLLFFWRKEQNRKKFFNGTKGGIQQFIYETKQSEFGHLGALIVILFYTLVFLSNKRIELAAFCSLFNIVGNLYPIILQRYHRVRLNRFI